MTKILRINESDYSYENPPPVKNWLFYISHCVGKIFAFIVFGLGSLILSLTGVPLCILIYRDRVKRRKAGHRLVSFIWYWFIKFLKILNLANLIISKEDRAKFRSLKSKIIVANHPSLLDVMMLVSLIPDADCVVNAYLMGANILHVIVGNFYIPASLQYEELVSECVKSLKSGSCLIIFPEGTRSLPSGQNPYKKGAARIALASGCEILPVYMGGNDKRGFRKHDRLFKYNTRAVYRYKPVMKAEISPEPYKDLPEPIAARRLMKEIKSLLSDEANVDNIEVDI